MHLSFVRFIAALLILPGLAALVANGSLKTYYIHTLPHESDDIHVIPLSGGGETVYLTSDQDEQMQWLWLWGWRGFLGGLAVGLLSLGITSSHLEQHHEAGGYE